MTTIINALGDNGAFVTPAEYDKQIDGRQVSVTFEARFSTTARESIIEALESQPGVRRVRVEVLG